MIFTDTKTCTLFMLYVYKLIFITAIGGLKLFHMCSIKYWKQYFHVNLAMAWQGNWLILSYWNLEHSLGKVIVCKAVLQTTPLCQKLTMVHIKILVKCFWWTISNDKLWSSSDSFCHWIIAEREKMQKWNITQLISGYLTI